MPNPNDPPPVEQLTTEEARRIALRAQGFLGPSGKAGDVPGMLARTGAVQLDTISVLARSHELVAYARLGAVGRAAVEDAYWGEESATFEYYAHAACVLPVEAWPYFAFRRRAMRRRRAESRESLNRAIEEVRARLGEGPVTVSDLGGARNGGGWWSWSETKLAAELLYVQGDAACTTRRGWKRVYDLPERAIPAALLGHEPTDQECYDYLVRRAGVALGVGTRNDIADYFRLNVGMRWSTDGSKKLLDAALENSGLVPVSVEGWDEGAYAGPAGLGPNNSGKHRTTLLSPFDSLIWERRRVQRLFGFALSLEAYKPKGQRLHGYFSMPLLAGGRLAGRVDPAREGRTLVARKVTLDSPAATRDMAAALREAASWVACDTIRVEQVEPKEAGPLIRAALS